MSISSLSRAERFSIYRRDGFACAVCGYPSFLQLHHYIRRGCGGSNHPHNLVTLCSKCHSVVHGYDTYDGFAAADVEQAIVEYLADYYAERGEAWNPYLAVGAEPARLDHEPDDGDFIIPVNWRGRH